MAGHLFVLEGIDGSGKTTQAQLLVAKLQHCLGSHRVLHTWEPGATFLGAKIKEMLLKNNTQLDPLTQLWLFMADRSCHIGEVIGPALAAGYIIICDRFTLSSLVYQGHLVGSNALDIVRVANKITCGDIEPITIFLNISPNIAAKRLRARKENNVLDSSDAGHLQRLNTAYLLECSRLNNCWIIDGNNSPDKVSEDIFNSVVQYLHKENYLHTYSESLDNSLELS